MDFHTLFSQQQGRQKVPNRVCGRALLARVFPRRPDLAKQSALRISAGFPADLQLSRVLCAAFFFFASELARLHSEFPARHTKDISPTGRGPRDPPSLAKIALYL